MGQVEQELKKLEAAKYKKCMDIFNKAGQNQTYACGDSLSK